MLPFINDHLTELDDQVTFRINRFETVVKESEARRKLVQETVQTALLAGAMRNKLLKKN